MTSSVFPDGNSAMENDGRPFNIQALLPEIILGATIPPHLYRAEKSRKKGGRTSFTKQQIAVLEECFEKHKYLVSKERSHIAEQLGMSDSQVKTWFQNRRTKWRRQEAIDRLTVSTTMPFRVNKEGHTLPLRLFCRSQPQADSENEATNKDEGKALSGGERLAPTYNARTFAR